MKKTLTLVLILLLVAVSSLFVFVGCGYADDGSIYLPEAPIGSDANNGSNGIENGTNNGSNGIENGAENGAENGVPVTPEDVKVVWNTGKAGENVTWTYYGDNTLEFTGFGAMYDNEHKYLDWTNYASFAKSITISDEITTLSPYALSGARGIAEIVLPSKLTEIAEGALVNCSRLSSVTIPGGVTSIGKNAFFSCYGLTNINIPDSVVSIGERAFYSCPIEEVAAPASAILHMEKSALKTVVITSGNEIESNAFSGCSSLQSVTIPASVTSIGSSAFENCSSLTSITIPDGVTSIGDFSFSGCSSLTYNEYDNAYYLGNTNNLYVVLVKAKNASITSCIVNDKTKFIYSNAFDGCSGLKSVTIPDSVVSIGERAFYSCPIEEVTAPASAILHMEKSALKTVVITSGNEINSNAFSGCTALQSVTIPDSVTSIGSSAFENCSSLQSIAIPDSVTSIGSDAFSGCSSLTYNEYDNAYYLGNTNNLYVVLVKAKNASITSCIVNDKTKLICSSAFYNCSSLQSITIPDSVTEIGSSAFRDCSKLTSITIPDSVTSIGDYAFGGCPIEEATIPASAILHMEKSALKTVVITSGNEIKSNAFSGCTALQSVTIPTSVTSIGYGAFSGCSSLTSITIPDSITEIGEDPFYNCSSLTYNEYDNAYYLGNANNPYVVLVHAKNTSITSCIVNDKTKLIYQYAFKDCSGLTSIIISDSVTSIGEDAFYNCSGLTYNEYDNAYYLGNANNPYVVLVKAKNTSITSCIVNDKTKVIYSSAFEDCSSLQSITIPDSVTSIGDGAFAFCSSLQSITIPEGVTKICRTVFYGCGSLQSITIPDSVTSIGDFALVGCHSLKSITLPKKLTLIESAAFYDCNILEKVYYKGTESEWNNVTALGANFSLYDATKYFYSETKPTGSGNYWHYDKDGNIVEW